MRTSLARSGYYLQRGQVAHSRQDHLMSESSDEAFGKRAPAGPGLGEVLEAADDGKAAAAASARPVAASVRQKAISACGRPKSTRMSWELHTFCASDAGNPATGQKGRCLWCLTKTPDHCRYRPCSLDR